LVIGLTVTKFCRGGFYKQYITIINNLYKPALAQPTIYINLDLYRMRKMYKGFTVGWGRVL